MAEASIKHKLTAILAADAAGFSRLMAIDERATLSMLDAARAVFRVQIELHRGRVVDMAGDSVLAVFEAATGAVDAALAIQQALNLAGAAEALALAERLGLDARTTLAVIGESSGQSWIGGDRLPRALDGDFAPRAHTTLLAKDSALAVAMAAQAGLRPTLGVAAATLFQAALAAGHGGDDDARMLTLMRSLIAAPGPATGPGPDPDTDRPGPAPPCPPAAG